MPGFQQRLVAGRIGIISLPSICGIGKRWSGQSQTLYHQITGSALAFVSTSVEPLRDRVSELKNKVQSILDSRQSLAQEFDQLRQAYSQQTAALQSSQELAGSLAAERDNLTVQLQHLQGECQRLQQERDSAAQLEATPEPDWEQWSAERAQLLEQQAMLQARITAAEGTRDSILTAMTRIFPADYYRSQQPELAQVSDQDLIDHFIGHGQSLELPPYHHVLQAELANLAQQRDEARAKLSLLEANFAQTTSEISTLKDLLSRLLLQAATPSAGVSP
jgi:chromosome segregation ATPase